MRDLGRRPEAHRQQARGERIERSGVTGFYRLVVTLRRAHGAVRRDSAGLVEQQHAVHPAPRLATLCAGGCHHFLRRRLARFVSSATAASINCDRRAPRSTEASWVNASWGTVRISNRCASWLRRKPVACSRPWVASTTFVSSPTTVKQTFASLLPDVT